MQLASTRMQPKLYHRSVPPPPLTHATNIHIHTHRCWVGKRHLDLAMEAVKDEFEFWISWKPFLLNPNVPEEGMPVEEVLKRKYGPQAAEAFLSGQSSFVQAGTKVVSKQDTFSQDN